ncbi:LGFP repeat-containing protein [Deinococcus oregonensis]|uniref:LGFP repeat-containing protein n=1 Tax=Deinococcus oregonensis TaxID=1805970 RepID=A0ABV6B273_9DEIO
MSTRQAQLSALFTLSLTLGSLFCGSALASPASEINEKAALLGLGVPTSGSVLPRQTPAPRSQGYWQAFERGWVYWSPAGGARAVLNPLFGRWASEHWEQGPLGFPVADQALCSSASDQGSYQIFEGGRIVLDNATGVATVYLNPTTMGDGGNCTPLSARGPATRLAHVRITILGFTANTWTADDFLEGDGKGDETFVRSQVRVLGQGGQILFSSDSQTSVYGDVNGHPKRLLAGTRRGNLTGPLDGGLQSGDSVPSRTPWTLGAAPEAGRSPRRLPLTVFDSDIDPENFTLVLVPSLWEWDGGGSWVQDLFSALLINGSDIIGGAAAAAGNQRDLSGLGRAFIGVNAVINTLGGQPGDRPIGIQPVGADRYAYRPTVLVWSARGLELAAQQRVNNLPQGVQALAFRDDPQSRGDYTLYLKYEYAPR